MTLPFDPNTLFTTTTGDQTIDQGQTGQAGGGTVTPQPTPPEQVTSTGECTIGGLDCPPGSICQLVETGLTAFGIPVYTTQCVPTTTTGTTGGTTTTCPPLGTFIGCTGVQTEIGGIAEFSNGLQEGGLCSTYTAIDERCAPPTPPPTPICQDNKFQCGPLVQVDETTTATTCCNAGETCCAKEDGSYYCTIGPCPTPKLPICEYRTTTVSCSELLGEEYTGTVRRIIKIGPDGCVDDPQVNLNVDTEVCTRIDVPFCEYVTETTDCVLLPGQPRGVTGRATRNRIKTDALGNPVPLGCQANPAVNTIDWDVTNCEIPPPPEQYRLCGVSSNFEYVTVLPPGYGSTYDDYGVCYDRVWVYCGNPSFNNRGTPPNNYVYNQSRNCWSLPAVDPTPTVTGVVKTCTAPIGGFNRTRDIPCTTLGSQYIGGIAKQQQVREYDPTGPANTVCEYTDWEDSGTPDTSFCQIANVPVTCTPPDGPSTRDVSIPCSQVDIKFTKGTATQKQVRRYDATATGPGTCPYTWENSGAPNTSTCQAPTFWRNCVTGELIEGTPPSDYIQSAYEKGGSCWEPIADLGFVPNLSQALRYTYQRGSSKFPETKTITVSNPSYGQAYTVKITTNENIKLSTNKAQSNKGVLSFTVEPRSETKLSVTITPELLQQLQDGLSSLSMTVEYDRVL